LSERSSKDRRVPDQGKQKEKKGAFPTSGFYLKRRRRGGSIIGAGRERVRKAN